jgi:transposase, IS6 family
MEDRVRGPGMGFFSFDRVANPCWGSEMMNMLRKGQIYGVEKRESMKRVAFIASLFGVAA